MKKRASQLDLFQPQGILKDPIPKRFQNQARELLTELLLIVWHKAKEEEEKNE